MLAVAGGTSKHTGEGTSKAGPVKLGGQDCQQCQERFSARPREGNMWILRNFPPALPDGSAAGAHPSEQLLIVQAADLRRARRKAADMAVWTRYFILFMATVTKKEPERLVDLLGYMDAIVRAAQKFAWPPCAEHDRHFRQMVAGDESRLWAQLDAGLYTECYTAQVLRWSVARQQTCRLVMLQDPESGCAG